MSRLRRIWSRLKMALASGTGRNTFMTSGVRIETIDGKVTLLRVDGEDVDPKSKWGQKVLKEYQAIQKALG